MSNPSYMSEDPKPVLYCTPDYHCNLDLSLVVVPTVGTYIECHYIDHLTRISVRTLRGRDAPSGAF